MSDPFAELPKGHYGAILADPPWRFATWNKATAIICDSWGFEYKTCAFDWMKAHAGQVELFHDEVETLMGMGYWTRANSEPCLLATRGKPKRLNADVRQGIIAPRREHSRKPDGIHERIERLVAGPYLELFARQKRLGWDCWGNETDKLRCASELYGIIAESNVLDMANAVKALSNNKRRKACREYRNAHNLPHPRANRKPVFYEPTPIPEPIKKKVAKIVEKQKATKSAVPFYENDGWLELRYRALKLYGGICQCCGNRPSRGNPLHVDHIKPRSKYPELELDIDNLQVLCKQCNLGKRAWDETDWRCVGLPA